MRLLLGHTYVGKRADRNNPGRFPRRTVIHISRDGTVTYCRNERETSFKFYEIDVDCFLRWADEDRTVKLWAATQAGEFQYGRKTVK